MRLPVLLVLVLSTGCIVRAAGPQTTYLPPQGGAVASTRADEVPARPSPGCRSGAGNPAGWRKLESGGRTRSYLLRLPAKASKPMPLVLNFHGWLENARQQEILTFMTPEASARGMAVVYPQGIGWSWDAHTCCGRAFHEQVDDMQFVRDLLDRLERELCIDENRVYSTGMSNGGIFSYRLACELPDRIAAIAPVAGAEDTPGCAPSRPVPVMAFHGAWDTIVPISGGFVGRFPSAEATMAAWARRDGCRAAPTRSSWSHGEASCVAADGCAQGSDVVLCTAAYGGHTWPGGALFPILGHTTGDIDATSSMLEFFLAHPMRAPEGMAR